MNNREKWASFLEAIEKGEKSWPMHDGRVNKMRLTEPEYTGISRSMLYQGALAAEIDAVIAKVNDAATQEARKHLTDAAVQAESQQVDTPAAQPKAADALDTAKAFRKKEDEYKRRINKLEQRITELQASLDKALLKIRQYEHERNTGRIATQYSYGLLNKQD